MELRVSSLKPAGLSPSDCASDPEEKEVSDEEDDDRNHKHRRRETRSQSLERETLEPVFARSFRKRNKPFENGHMFRENESQASNSWRNNNNFSMEKDFVGKFEKRRPGLSSQPRGPLELNQRIRGNQIFSGDPGSGRGRGRDSGGWSRDSRFSAIDIASQMVQQGSIAPSLFAGRGLPNVPTAQSASWSPFGLVPGMPNGGLDTLHPIGLPGIRPPLTSSLNMGIPRQRCRDFEERGFCLRGDMCPMEHGVNRIVVEDVQSLSQFNLPVSLASAQLVGPPAGPGPLSSVGASSNTIINSKGIHGKSSKPGVAEDGLGFNSAYSSSNVGGADLYDPDQPLWNNNCPETSTALLALHSPKIDEVESLLNVDPSDRHHTRLSDSADNEGAVGSQGTSLSVWGRIGSSRNRSDMKEKIDSTINSSDYLGNETREDQEASANAEGTLRQGKQIFAKDAGPKAMDSSPKMQGDSVRHIRKPSQKALRTLFVNGIPQKNNKREALLSHFRKFGEVIDIYIPLNSERAFVQFSKREEAEAALKAPDAVMGNRFIKLWWANRDSIPDDGTSTSSSVSATAHGGTAASALSSHPSVANRGKDNAQSSASKGNVVSAADVSMPASDHPKTVITNGPKVLPPLQKKLESLEQLKEELRKKQEMLDQKRNDFRRQLHKLEKQATGVKGEVIAEPAAKRHKAGVADDVEQAATTGSSEPGAAMASPGAETMTDKNRSMENIVSHSPKISTAMVLPESMSSKQPIRPLAAAGHPFLMNRYKLDNRPTAFRIAPPLPAGFANLAALSEHFSSYGDLSNVEIEETEPCDGVDGSETMKNCSAQITFTTRRSAERAFTNGKCWQGHDLQFMWLTPSHSPSGRESSSASKGAVDAVVQPAENTASMGSKEAAASENEEPEFSEIKGDVELQEVSQPCTIPVSGKKESPEGSVC